MRKKVLKGIADILFISMFLIPVTSKSISGNGQAVAPMSIEGPGIAG
ncbi:hypothetical protein [Clostridium manihotivorum]|nr:hypothetical protein [Clostridium manihotivorum]